MPKAQRTHPVFFVKVSAANTITQLHVRVGKVILNEIGKYPRV